MGKLRRINLKPISYAQPFIAPSFHTSFAFISTILIWICFINSTQFDNSLSYSCVGQRGNIQALHTSCILRNFAVLTSIYRYFQQKIFSQSIEMFSPDMISVIYIDPQSQDTENSAKSQDNFPNPGKIKIFFWVFFLKSLQRKRGRNRVTSLKIRSNFLPSIVLFSKHSSIIRCCECPVIFNFKSVMFSRINLIYSDFLGVLRQNKKT